MRVTSRRDPETTVPAEHERPLPASPHFVLALQRSAGNVAVCALLARAPAAKVDTAHGELFDWEVPDELERLARMRLDDASIRTIQWALDTPITGAFTPQDVRAMARLRVARHLPRNAEIDRLTLDRIVRKAVGADMQDEAIHVVADYHRLDTISDTLSLRFSADPDVAAKTQFDPSGLRRISLGAGVLTGEDAIRRAIVEQLATPPRVAAQWIPPGPSTPILNDRWAEAAAAFNRGVLLDARSIRAVQHTLGVPYTGVFDPETCEAIAQRQQLLAFSHVDGQIDEPMFHDLIMTLNADEAYDSILRLVIDYQRIAEDGVVDASVDPTFRGPDDYAIRAVSGRAAAAIRFGPDLFFDQPEGLVHTVARAYEEVRLRHQGVKFVKHQFLLERFTMLSQGMSEEAFTPFMAGAVKLLDDWRALTPDEQAGMGAELESVRAKLRARWLRATPAERHHWQQTHDEILALPVP